MTLGGQFSTSQIAKEVPLKLGDKVFNTDLVNLGNQDLDVILGMSWMSRHGVTLDSQARNIRIDSPSHGTFTFCLSTNDTPTSSACALVQARLEDIPMVCEYPDVFPDDLPGMPLDRDLEFAIELQPGTAPISKRPYRMPPNELAVLKPNSRSFWTRDTSGRVLRHGAA